MPEASSEQAIPQAKPEAAPREPLPDDIVWLTNESDPIFASPKAKKGGTFHEALPSFPLTFRTVGPDSNTAFRDAVLGNQLSLVGMHPNTLNIIPELATHWAFGTDKKTMYFKLNPKARWSDGVPVTADDFAFTLEFMRSAHIVAPWYNDFYTKEIDRVIVYDDHTLAVVSTKAQPDLELFLSLQPHPPPFLRNAGRRLHPEVQLGSPPQHRAVPDRKVQKGALYPFHAEKRLVGRATCAISGTGSTWTR